MPPAISAHALSKRYRLRHLTQRSGSFHDAVTAAPRTLWNRVFGRSVEPTEEEFWALRDVDLTIEQGEKVGIIGRNGAGKSTLLKILSRIVEPTSGHGVITGRLASLLEVGTGFHPELSGRENIYLNGAILGMSRAEILRAFDAIVAFAEIERFLDTPVKRYSSGMYVRLAFAVAAHLEPEILIIDEVLAVGDARFQKKCLGKMDDIGREGRTLLFVSHNLPAVQKLCGRVLVFRDGRIADDAEPPAAIASYMGSVETCALAYTVRPDALSCRRGPIWITALQVRDATGAPAATLATGDSITLRVDYEASDDVAEWALSFKVVFKGALGQEIIRLSTTPISGFSIDPVGRSGTLELTIDSLPFTAGRYFVDVGITRPLDVLADYLDALTLEVQPRDVYESGFSLRQAHCLIVTPHRWRHHRTDQDGTEGEHEARARAQLRQKLQPQRQQTAQARILHQPQGSRGEVPLENGQQLGLERGDAIHPPPFGGERPVVVPRAVQAQEQLVVDPNHVLVLPEAPVVDVLLGGEQPGARRDPEVRQGPRDGRGTTAMHGG